MNRVIEVLRLRSYDAGVYLIILVIADEDYFVSNENGKL
jgi:hypothetical protein